MKFSVFTTAIAMVGSVVAYPTSAPEVSAEPVLETRNIHEMDNLKRQTAPPPTHMFYCTGKDWTGECQNWRVEKQKCYNIKQFGERFVKNTGSTGPDAGTFCTFYNVENCGTNQDRLYSNYPGYPHLDGHNWNKKAVSFRCW